MRTLHDGPRHGWAIAERIQFSRDVLQVNQGSLCPALHRLEHEGWIEADWGVSGLGRRARDVLRRVRALLFRGRAERARRGALAFGAMSPSRSRPGAPDPARARTFSRRLRAWYRRAGRDLPWRNSRDPYEILVSEAMLQQTQVSRVLQFYPRFLKRFPSLHHLAAATPARVMESWEGLGYYARAQNLHKLARHVTRGGGSHNAGALPSHPHELRKLPGVGAYTAGAVASFAYERRSAAVDTNVARVLSRVFAPRLDPKRPRDLTRLWVIAKAVLPRTGKVTWTHNQAIMELGALVCTARVKRCGACPVSALCASSDVR